MFFKTGSRLTAIPRQGPAANARHPSDAKSLKPTRTLKLYQLLGENRCFKKGIFSKADVADTVKLHLAKSCMSGALLWNSQTWYPVNETLESKVNACYSALCYF